MVSAYITTRDDDGCPNGRQLVARLNVGNLLPVQGDVLVIEGENYQVINRWFYLSKNGQIDEVQLTVTKF